MRNPIPASPDRPIPLPDCILMDGWWAHRPDPRPREGGRVLRLVTAEPAGSREGRPSEGVRVD